ncbi:MAG: ABC transporter substrate-binding protein [bacterium]
MLTKKSSFIIRISLILLLTLAISTISLAQDEYDPVDSNIPESWFEDTQTASELGIESFNESPMTAEKVENGELPPVEERLPEDPPVIEPYAETGEYGGQLELWSNTLKAYEEQLRYFQVGAGPGQSTPDGSYIKEFLFEDFYYNDDHTERTYVIREGTKFSDGQELTADDFVFWWDHVATHEKLTPFTWPNRVDVEKDNDYQFTVYFEDPVSDQRTNPTPDRPISPHEFMEQFHADIVGEEEANSLAEEEDFDSWNEYYDYVSEDSVSYPDATHVRPDLVPYIITERTNSYTMLERNPYYPFVDTEGNQLPYIDKIRVNRASDAEMAGIQATTGQSDFEARYTQLGDMSLYKRNAEEEDYNVFLYDRPFGSVFSLMPNHSHKDEDMREIFHDFRFRRALSHAIDREEINDKIYFGQAKPMQATVPAVNSYYKEEYAQAYAEHDIELAKELLDEMGMEDVNDDGFRERPDGEKFSIDFLLTEHMDSIAIAELIDTYMEDIGINFNIQPVSRELFQERRMANDFDMSHWAVDVQLDIFFGDGLHTAKTFTPTSRSWEVPWPAWGQWYETDGEEGMEPQIEKAKELMDLLDDFNSTFDEESKAEIADEIISAQAENLWTIGTVGMAPQPVIASKRLKNVPESGIWDAAAGYMEAYMPQQFYLED